MGGLGGAAFGGGIGQALGTVATFFTAKLLQEDAQQFQTSFYKQRYQRQMEDMRLAGLNPILAYKTGVPGTAGGGIASGGGAAGNQGPAFAAAAARLKEVEDEEKVRRTKTSLNEKLGETAEAQARAADAAARNSDASANLNSANAQLKATELPKAHLLERFFQEIGTGAGEVPSAATLFQRGSDFMRRLNSDGAPSARRTGPPKQRHESFNSKQLK